MHEPVAVWWAAGWKQLNPNLLWFVVRRLDLSENGLATLVEAFYARVRADAELGPIFEDAIDDWPEHLEKLAAFWSSIMLTVDYR